MGGRLEFKLLAMQISSTSNLGKGCPNSMCRRRSASPKETLTLNSTPLTKKRIVGGGRAGAEMETMASTTGTLHLGISWKVPDSIFPNELAKKSMPASLQRHSGTAAKEIEDEDFSGGEYVPRTRS